MDNECFRLKGSVITTFILEFSDYDTKTFTQQLNKKVETSPEFFKQSPVIIDFNKLNLKEYKINYSEIISICRDNGLQPIGFRQNDELDLSSIEKTKLAVIKHNSHQTDNKTKEKASTTQHRQDARVISKPVRSGQQIYAENCDLIILGSVSGGAEVLADGNIHIYGSLRGRALAGINGNKNARIFCLSNDAELVSIAGHFLLSDSLEQQPDKQPTQFQLIDEVLHVSPL